MKILLSPAKSIDTTLSIPTPTPTTAVFLDDATKLASKLATLKDKELMQLMHVSDSIAELNVQRYKNWIAPTQLTDECKPAATVFTGEVYRGLNVASFSEDDFLFANQQVRILSGLYGILKPLDLLYPYRLEMGTKWQISPKIKNLYAYWDDKISNYLTQELATDEAIINLASTEYFKAIQPKKIKNRIITPHFKDFKNGEYKVVMMYAKNARGKMAHYAVKNRIENPELLKEYNEDNYRFDSNLSTENDWVFTR